MTIMNYSVYDKVMGMFLLVGDTVRIRGEVYQILNVTELDDCMALVCLDEMDDEQDVVVHDTDIVELVKPDY